MVFRTVIGCHGVGGRNIITIFRHSHFSHCSGFTHVNRKSLKKGKHNLTFVSGVMGHRIRFSRFRGTAIIVPGAIILYASVFSRFVSAGDLCRMTLDSTSSSAVLGTFLHTGLPSHLIRSFFTFFSIIGSPVTVHSSDLLRSSRCRPFTKVCSACVVPCLSSGCRVLHVLDSTVGKICTSIFFESDGTCVRTADGIVSRRGVTIVLRRIINARCNSHFCPSVSKITHSLGCCPVKSRGTRRKAMDLTLKLNGCVMSKNLALEIYPCRPGRILRADRVRVTLHRARARFCTLSLGGAKRGFSLSSNFGLLGLPIGRTSGSKTLAFVTSACSPCSVVVHSKVCPKNQGIVAFTGILRRSMFPLPHVLRLMRRCKRDRVEHPIRVRFTIALGRRGGGNAFCLLRVHPVISIGTGLRRSLGLVGSRSILLGDGGSLKRNVVRSVRSIVCIGASNCATSGGPAVTCRVRGVGHGFLSRKGRCVLMNPKH